MKNITEKKLKALGFKKIKVSAKESGDIPYYYFTLDIGKIGFISGSNDECPDGNYYVEFCEYQDNGRFYSAKKLTRLIKIIKSAIK